MSIYTLLIVAIDRNKSYEREQLFKARIVLDEMNERLGVKDKVVSS